MVMFLTLLFGFFTLLGVLLTLPKTRRWLLSCIHIFGQDEKTAAGARIYAYRRNQGIYHLAEIYNSGPEDVVDLKISISWESDQGKQDREIHEYLDNGADPTFARPHDCNTIAKNERILIANFPFKNLALLLFKWMNLTVLEAYM